MIRAVMSLSLMILPAFAFQNIGISDSGPSKRIVKMTKPAYPASAKTAGIQRCPVEAAVLGPDECVPIEIRPLPVGKQQAALGRRMLEFVFVPIAALTRRSAYLRVGVLAQDPAARKWLFKNGKRAAHPAVSLSFSTHPSRWSRT